MSELVIGNDQKFWTYKMHFFFVSQFMIFEATKLWGRVEWRAYWFFFALKIGKLQPTSKQGLYVP